MALSKMNSDLDITDQYPVMCSVRIRLHTEEMIKLHFKQARNQGKSLGEVLDVYISEKARPPPPGYVEKPLITWKQMAVFWPYNGRCTNSQVCDVVESTAPVNSIQNSYDQGPVVPSCACCYELTTTMCKTHNITCYEASRRVGWRCQGIKLE